MANQKKIKVYLKKNGREVQCQIILQVDGKKTDELQSSTTLANKFGVVAIGLSGCSTLRFWQALNIASGLQNVYAWLMSNPIRYPLPKHQYYYDCDFQ